MMNWLLRLLILSFFGVALVSLAGLLASGPRVHADEKTKGKRYVVRCSEALAQRIAADVRKEGGEIWDLESMKPLATNSDAAAPQAGAYMKPISAPADALYVWSALETSLQNVPVMMTDLTVQERRASLRIQSKDAALLDKVRQALEADPHVKSRGGTVAVGSLQQSPNGYKQRFTIHFSAGVGARPPLPPFKGSITRVVSTAAAHANADLRWAGAERSEPDRVLGHRDVWREFKFGSMSLPALKTLLSTVLREAPNLTVTELRWQLDPKAPVVGTVNRPTFKLGWRGSL